MNPLSWKMIKPTSWWSSPERNLVYARWGVLVLINALFPLLLAASMLNQTPQFIGIALAIASFIVIYAEIDLWLIDQHYFTLSAQLRTSAVIKMGTVLLPFIDMVVGMFSMTITRMITGFDLKTIAHTASKHYEIDCIRCAEPSTLLATSLTYLTTMIDGVLLTLLVGLILLALRPTQKRWGKRKTNRGLT